MGRMILHVRPIGLLTGIGVTRESALRALGACAKNNELFMGTPIWPLSGTSLWRHRACVLLCLIRIFTAHGKKIKKNKKHRIVYCTANLASVRDLPLAGPSMRPVMYNQDFHCSREKNKKK